MNNEKDKKPDNSGTSTSPENQGRVIRVFVSSTFRDMHAEREELIKFVFPELRTRCRARQVEFTEVDLRWGITEEQKAEGKVLPVCLAEIERCRPYFIGLLGERYGYIPEHIDGELLKMQSWLKEHKEKSITELEMLYGVLKDPEMRKLSFFYFRDLKTSLRIEKELAKRPDYSSEQEASVAKLKSLKEKIRSHASTYPVPVRENYPDAKTLGRQVLEDLWKVVDERFPEAEIPTELEKDRMEHEAFADTRRKVYIGREEYFTRLDEHILSDSPPLILLGESGSGKSALIANWVGRYREKHPDDLMVMHFIGSTPDSADYVRILRRIIEEIKEKYEPERTERMQGLLTKDEEQIPNDSEKVVEIFPLWLAKASASGMFILILDALNQLEDRDNAPDLSWLPEYFPPNVRVILSTLPGRSLDALNRRNWQVLHLQPIQIEEIKQFSEKYLAQYRKGLSKEHTERIADAKQCSNPLYLRTLLEELRVLGRYEELDNRINYYLAAVTVEDLFELVLERLESDYEYAAETIGMVKYVMSLIWASRRGLSEIELLDLLGRRGEPLQHAHWSPFYLAVEESLVSKTGLLNFSHNFLRKAVEDRYLHNSELRRNVHLRLAAYFEKRELDYRKVDELPWQLRQSKQWEKLKNCITDIEMFLRLRTKVREYELMGYWLAIGDRFDMVECYNQMLHTNEISLSPKGLILTKVALYFYLNARYADAEPLFKRSLEIYEKYCDYPELSILLNDLALLYNKQGKYAESEPLYKRSLEIGEKIYGKDSLFVALTLNNLSALYFNQDKILRAESIGKRALEIYEKYFGGDHPDMALSLNTLATLYVKHGRYADAESLYKRSLKIFEKYFGGDHPNVATSLSNLANLYRDQGRYAEAEPLNKHCLKIFEKYFGGDHPDVATSLNNLAALYSEQGRYAEAEPLYKRSIEITEKVLGGDHPNVANPLNNLALLYSKQGRYAEAEPLYKRSLEISEKVLGGDHPNVAINNLALLYHEQGRYAEAEPLYKRSIEIKEKVLGGDHNSVATSMNNLALLYHEQGRYAEVEPLYKRSIEITEKVLGGDHPDVATSLNNLALLYSEQGRYADAEPLYKRSLEIRERVLGGDHPDVATLLNNLAGLYKEQGRYTDAEPLYKRSLEITENVLGDNHIDVGTILKDLALLYSEQKRYAEAETLWKRALIIAELVLGSDHPEIVRIKYFRKEFQGGK
jgi:nephrocystin-3